MLEELKQSFSKWTKLDYAWLIIANLTILSLSLYWGDSLTAIISAMAGITCVIFISKQMIANYYFGIVNVALYALLSFEAKLYGDFALNAFIYFPAQFFGLYLWTKAKRRDKDNEVKVRRLTNKQRFYLALGCFIAILISAEILELLEGNIVILDAASTIISIIAQILMLFLYVEQWYLWVIVNIVSVTMWALSLSNGVGDTATLIMWILYLANSLYGLYNWRKASKENN